MRTAPTLLVVLALGALAGCSSEPPPKDFRTTSLATSPEPFQAVRSALARLARSREQGDAAGARASFPDVLAASKRLLTMTPPHDLKREDVSRFLEGRARYSDALNAYGRAQEGADDDALWRATKELEGSFWAWYDAYRGKPSEGAV